MDGASSKPIDGRKLILEAAGGYLPGERVNQLLQRVADKDGLGIRSIEQLWKGQYASKKTVLKLENRKQEKARNNADKVASTIALLDDLARVAPSADAEILRAAADTLRHGNLRET